MSKTKDIREAVERELRHDSRVDAAGITVKNMNGNVVLVGTVPSYPQYLEAAGTARRVAGVTDVHNHLEVVLPEESRRDDATLTTAANDALAASASVPEGVRANAEDGNLTLTGTVRYGSQRAAARSAVGELTGVRNIHDKTELAFNAEQADVKRRVKETLERHGLDSRAVAVNTSGNSVILSGQVRIRKERDAVVRAAWRGHDVMAVIDEIEIIG